MSRRSCLGRPPAARLVAGRARLAVAPIRRMCADDALRFDGIGRRLSIPHRACAPRQAGPRRSPNAQTLQHAHAAGCTVDVSTSPGLHGLARLVDPLAVHPDLAARRSALGRERARLHDAGKPEPLVEPLVPVCDGCARLLGRRLMRLFSLPRFSSASRRHPSAANGESGSTPPRRGGAAVCDLRRGAFLAPPAVAARALGALPAIAARAVLRAAIALAIRALPPGSLAAAVAAVGALCSCRALGSRRAARRAAPPSATADGVCVCAGAGAAVPAARGACCRD